jgi:hypothetical protein
MGWGKPKPNTFGGFKKERNDRGQHESLHGPNVDGDVSRTHHVHYHKDGMTVQKGKQKYTVSRRYCSNCCKETSQRRNNNDTWYCSNCQSHMASYPK